MGIWRKITIYTCAKCEKTTILVGMIFLAESSNESIIALGEFVGGGVAPEGVVENVSGLLLLAVGVAVNWEKDVECDSGDEA